MILFRQREQREAIAHAASGGQALHIISGSFAYLRPDTPDCAKGLAYVAHLFDQDTKRLVSTATRLGVRQIRIERAGQPGQHIDLFRGPLERAIREAVRYEKPAGKEAVGVARFERQWPADGGHGRGAQPLRGAPTSLKAP